MGVDLIFPHSVRHLVLRERERATSIIAMSDTLSYHPSISASCSSPKIVFTVPHSARIWNYWLGGKDNYPVDRAAGAAWAATHPQITADVRSSRKFVLDAVGDLAGFAGVRQFVDIGTGLPFFPNVHEVVQQVEPDCRVVYVDNDPLVLTHARALHTPIGGGAPVTVVEADVREPERILEGAGENLDLTRPVAVVLGGVLGYVIDDRQVRSIITMLAGALSPGSYLVICDGTGTHPAVRRALAAYLDTGARPYVLRSPEQLAAFVEGLSVLAPGLVPLDRWRAGPLCGRGAGCDSYGMLVRTP
jgi:S-adenosyl methyltransferase